MAAVARGEPDGLSRLYDRYHRLVFTLCLRVLKDRGEAEDVLIEVFQELWERSARFDATRGSPLTYLSTLARAGDRSIAVAQWENTSFVTRW